MPIKKPHNNDRDNSRRRDRNDQPRVNERIRAPRVRVVRATGEQVGIMSTREALDLAKQEGLDLVEIAATTDPPVCRIVDYGKFKYQQAKQQKNNNSKTARQKEIKLGVAIDVNDYNVKMARAERFLDAGHKVRFVIRLKGRQNAHPELALEKLNQVIADMKTMAAVDQAPRQAGATSSMLLTPLPKQQRVLKFGNIEVTEEDDDADDDE